MIKYYLKAAGKLIVSLIVDIIGMLTYLAPGGGELIDVILAFICAAIVKSMYHKNSRENWVFWEEILPFTDIIPSATIIWFIKHLGSEREAKNEYLEMEQSKIDNRMDSNYYGNEDNTNKYLQ